jgi:hypothetical protein
MVAAAVSSSQIDYLNKLPPHIKVIIIISIIYLKIVIYLSLYYHNYITLNYYHYFIKVVIIFLVVLHVAGILLVAFM